MTTVIKLHITHNAVCNRTNEDSRNIMADMVKRAVEDKTGYWRETMNYSDPVSVKVVPDECYE